MLGSHLADLILKSTTWEIIGLIRRSSERSLIPESERLLLIDVELDELLFHKGQLEDAQALVHCAAMVSTHDNDADILEKVNVIGTRDVMDACLELEISKVVHVSSVAALHRDGSKLTTEFDHFSRGDLESAYAVSKYHADMEAYRARAEGLHVDIIRPSMILGPGQWQSGSDTFVDKTVKNHRFYPAGGTGVVDVRDVCEAIFRLLQRSGEALDVICNGHNATFLELQSLICQQLGLEPPTQAINKGSLPLLVALDRLRSFFTRKRSIISNAGLKRSMLNYFYDDALIRQSLGIEYRPLASTVSDVVNVYQSWKSQGKRSRLSF